MHRDSRNTRPILTAIARCRELLGDEADVLSDQDVDQIRQHADTMAHVLVQIFLENRAQPEWMRMARRGALLVAENESKLPPVVCAVVTPQLWPNKAAAPPVAS